MGDASSPLPTTEEVVDILRALYDLIVGGRFDDLAARQLLGETPAEAFRRALNAYPGEGWPRSGWTMPPDSALREYHIYESTDDRGQPRWAVDSDMWYGGERSDLTLSVILTRRKDGGLDAEICDAHAL